MDCNNSAKANDLRSVFRVVDDIAGRSRKGSKANAVKGDVWVEHFNHLFSSLAKQVDSNIFDRLECTADMELAEMLRNSISSDPPSLEEVRFAVEHLPSGKAPGGDDICAELYKHGGDESIRVLHHICVLIFEHETWPDEWAESTVVALFKKGIITDPDNYRGISLTAHAAKILCAILRRRLEVVVEAQVGEYQNGFRRFRGTGDAVLAYHLLSEKMREEGIPFYTCFIDFKKAFDSVNWDVLFHILRIAGVPQKLITILRSLYDQSSFRVRTTEGLSDHIKPVLGVRQGCILSPMLFILFLEFILRLTMQMPHEDAICIGKAIAEILGYADDLAIFYTSRGSLQERLADVDNNFLSAGMEVSITKTETMDQGTSDSPPAVHLRGEPLKACDSFKYLGAVQSKDASSRGAIKQRMGQASAAFNQLKKIWRAPMKLAVKGLLYCTTIRCILLYGAGAWTTLEEDFRLLETFDMGCVRHIQNVSRLEHIRSSELRARLGIDCSNMSPAKKASA